MDFIKENKIIALVIVMIIVTGLFYFVSNMTSSSRDNGLVNESESITQTQTGEDTSAVALTPPTINAPTGWNAFTKEGLDYGFAYRSDWNIDEASNRYTRVSHKDFKIEIVRQSKNPDESLERYSEKQAQGGEQKATVTEQERIMIDNFPALSETNSWLGGHFSARIVYVEKDNHVYSIVMRTSHKKSDVSDPDIQTFLDNFKFAEAE